MATIAISLSGSSIVNGSKNYTISDPDLQFLLNWCKANYVDILGQNPTNAQVLLSWFQGFINASINSEQQFRTPPPVIPVKIVIA